MERLVCDSGTRMPNSSTRYVSVISLIAALCSNFEPTQLLRGRGQHVQ